MSEIYSRQNEQDEMQRSGAFVDAFSKIVSGKPGYRAVIETKPIVVKCKGCGKNLPEEIKFCPDCGRKNLIPAKKCPSCSKFFSDETTKFCTSCGTKRQGMEE